MALLRPTVFAVVTLAAGATWAGSDEMTCGQELADSAEVPEKLARLMSHVAAAMDRHAAWVGVATPAARQEHDTFVRLAAEYRDIAPAATRAATTMRGARALPPVAHDPARFDRASTARWMRDKIAMQVDFAQTVGLPVAPPCPCRRGVHGGCRNAAVR